MEILEKITKEILDDYETKAGELESIRNGIYFILDANDVRNKDDALCMRFKYKSIQEHLPTLLDLLWYKINEMQEKTNSLYEARKDIKEHTEASPLN